MQGEMPGIQPSMVPTGIGVGFVQGQKELPDGSVVPINIVQVVITQPTGMTYVFFEPDAAIDTGLSLMEAGKQARSGLSVAKSLEGLPPLNGKGH